MDDETKENIEEMIDILSNMEDMLTDYEENTSEKTSLEQFVKTCGPLYLNIKLINNTEMERICTQSKNIAAITLKSGILELNKVSAGVLLSCLDYLTISLKNIISSSKQEIKSEPLNKRISWLEEKYKKELGLNEDLANKELFTTKELQDLIS